MIPQLPSASLVHPPEREITVTPRIGACQARSGRVAGANQKSFAA
jgi:hypothetical protein